jgi:hypothetical protein
VHFTLMVARHEFEAGLLMRLATRALIARRAVGEDVLRGLFPETTDISAALFEDGAIDPRAVSRPMITICRTWERPARVLARGVISRRALSRRWRAERIESPATFWTAIDRIPAIRSAAGAGSLLVFSVPLIDGTGAVAERHVVAIRVDSHHPSGRFDARALLRDRALIDAARSRAAAALAARARRLSRRLRRRLDADLRLETTLASRVLTSLVPAEIQPGLFDRRELRALDRARSDADALRQGLDDRRTDQVQQTEISVGQPALELAFIAS